MPNVIVTGASRGLGAAMARVFAGEGARVVCAARTLREGDHRIAGSLETTVAGIVASGGEAVAVAADIAQWDECARVVDEARLRCGPVDALINNAADMYFRPIEEFPVERWETILALMLTSPFLLAKAAWPALRVSGSGRFIAIASVHGLVASPYKAAYVSAKHGLIGLVKTLALEGAADGIRATAICPGYVRTPLVEKQIADQARAHGLREERVLEDVILASHAVKELVEPSDVADVVAFLAGPAGRAFSGVPVTMDQGWTAR